jgi:N-acetylglucosamine-6-phosphate deacetylase
LAFRALSGIGPSPIGAATVRFDRNIRDIIKRRSPVRDCLVPGLIDLQINGAYGIDVMSADANDLIRLSERLASDGTTSWLPTVVTSPLESIERYDRVIAEAMKMQGEMEGAAAHGSEQPVMASILGMHLEGPFISPKYLGAHPPMNLLPKGEALDRVLALESVKLVTLAPELEGALEAIRRLRRRGVAVSLGHSDATYAQAIAGVDAGARMFTHVFNAMRPLHHREPGIVGAALHNPRAYASFIGDGVHLHPELVQYFLSSSLSVLVSDRAAPAAARKECGSICDGLIKNVSLENGAARLPNGALAGGAISMLEAVRKHWKKELARKQDRAVMSKLCSTLASAASGCPASVISLSGIGHLRSGFRADLLLLDSKLKLKAVFVGGREVQ